MSNDREFTHFNSDWNFIFQTAKDLGYHLHENKRKHYLPVFLTKNDVKLEISSYLGSITFHVHSPFKWRKNFSFQNQPDNFEKDAQNEVLTTLRLLESNDWFQNVDLQKGIIEKLTFYKNLPLEQLKVFDTKKLSEIHHFLESMEIN